MTPKLRAMLDTIDDMLVVGDQNAADLWMVLSALRGPDINDWHLKVNCTIPIRRAALPRTAMQYNAYSSANLIKRIPANFDCIFNHYDLDSWEYGCEGSHFFSHADDAAQILELIPKKDV